MSVELLYTSAAQGLKQGSRGFCTVISTAGMPLNLATRLESLSAYRHVFAPGHPDAAQNPISFSHLRLNVGGRPLSILSRISDYGVDYSQRTNKLAHHVVLEGADLVPAGPAWVMSQPGVMRSQWDGQCTTPGSGPAIPATNQSPRVCMQWSSLCGDAGWGGVVAEVFAQPVGKPLWIIFPLNQSSELLALINESIALLAPAQRWQATFSTYATNLPPDADCKVRCVLAGTEDARLAPARGKVIDLSKPLPPIAPTAITPYVLAARNGTPVPGAVPSMPTAGTENSILNSPSNAPNRTNEVDSVPQRSEIASGGYSTSDAQVRSAVASARAHAKPPAVKRQQAAVEPNNRAAVAHSDNWLIRALTVVSVAALALLIAILVLVLRVPNASLPASQTVASSSSEDEVPAEELAPKPSLEKSHIPNEQNNSPPAPISEQEKEDSSKTPQPPASSTEANSPPLLEPSSKVPVTEGDAPNPDETKNNDSTAGTAAPPPPVVIPGKLNTNKLLEGQVWVTLTIPMPEGYRFKKDRYSFETNDTPREFSGTIATKDQPHLKHVRRLSAKPDEFVASIDPADETLNKQASAVSIAWQEIQSRLTARQESIKQLPSDVRTQLILIKPNEPKVDETLESFTARIRALQKAESDVEAYISTQIDSYSKLNTVQTPNPRLTWWQSLQQKIPSPKIAINTLLSGIEEVRKNGREYDTGTILYMRQLGESSDDNSVAPVAIAVRYTIVTESSSADIAPKSTEDK